MSLKNPRPVGNDLHGEAKYGLIEMPEYVKGRERMAKRGADLGQLYSIILMLRYGYMPPESCKPHKIQGDPDGRLECLVQGRRRDWVLTYRYDEKDLVPVDLTTRNHRESGSDRHDRRSAHVVSPAHASNSSSGSLSDINHAAIANDPSVAFSILRGLHRGCDAAFCPDGSSSICIGFEQGLPCNGGPLPDRSLREEGHASTERNKNNASGGSRIGTSEQVSVGPGSNGQKDQVILFQTVYEQPIRSDVAFAVPVVRSLERMIREGRRELPFRSDGVDGRLELRCPHPFFS